MKKVFCFCFFSKCYMVQLLWVRFEHHEMLNVTVQEITVQNNRLLPFPLSCNVTQIWFNLMGLGKMLDGRFWESTYGIRITVRKTVTARSLHINSVFVLVADTHLCLIVTYTCLCQHKTIWGSRMNCNAGNAFQENSILFFKK